MLLLGYSRPIQKQNFSRVTKDKGLDTKKQQYIGQYMGTYTALLWPYICITIINTDIESTLVGSSADQKGISWEKKETKIDRKIKKTKKEPQLANRHKIGGHCLPLTGKKQSLHY